MWTRTWLTAIWLWAGNTSAQVRPLPDADLPWSDGDDPIGVRPQDADLDRGPTPQHTPDAQAFGPKPPALSARRGDVLVAPASVRERNHHVQIEWHAGLALVTTELVFSATGERPTEVRYRLPTPHGAHLASLEACAAAGCRVGVPEAVGLLSAYDDAVTARGPGSGLPVAHAVATTDERGQAITLRAAPVRGGQDLTVRVAFLVAAPVRGGAVRLTLPARGIDERAAQAEVTLEASALTAVALGDAPLAAAPALFEPWRPIDLAARFAPSTPIATDWLRYRCGDQDCARAWLGAKSTALRDDDVALALDASPSMRGPARGRLSAAIAALLSVLPQDRPIDIAAFAAAARPVVHAVSPADIALTPLVDAVHAEDLGSGTRLTALWTTLQPWAATPTAGSRGKHLILLGDGTLSRDQAATFKLMQRAHVRVSSVNLSDRPTSDELRRLVTDAGGIALDVGAQAAQTASAPGAQEEALSTLFSERAGTLLTLLNTRSTGTERINLGTILAGSEVVWSGAAGRSARLLGVTRPPDYRRNLVQVSLLGTSQPSTARSERFGRALSLAGVPAIDALVAVDPADLALAGQGRPAPALQCDPRGPAQRASGISSDDDPVLLAEARPCRPRSPTPGQATASSAGSGYGMPASPLLTMLRQRILPVARGCFRRDRAGRAEYELRAIFELELWKQEVSEAKVTGDVPEPLRACLIEAADHLEIPYFTGVVRARYPLRTQAEPLPEEIELSEGVASDLDRLLDGPGGALHTPPAF